MDLNLVALVGRLTKRIDLRKTPKGDSVATFNIGVNRMAKKDEEAKADFPSIVAWGAKADYLFKYADKGDLISVSGSLRTRSYDSNGRTNYVTEVLADNVAILKKKENRQATENSFDKSYDTHTSNISEPTLTGGSTFENADLKDFSFNSDDLPFY